MSLTKDNVPAETIWVTKDGTRIPVRQMTNEHLVNSIRYLRRVGATEKHKGAMAGYSALSMLQGEMAIDSVESELHQLESQTVDGYLSSTRPVFEALVREVERRGLRQEEL